VSGGEERDLMVKAKNVENESVGDWLSLEKVLEVGKRSIGNVNWGGRDGCRGEGQSFQVGSVVISDTTKALRLRRAISRGRVVRRAN